VSGWVLNMTRLRGRDGLKKIEVQVCSSARDEHIISQLKQRQIPCWASVRIDTRSWSNGRSYTIDIRSTQDKIEGTRISTNLETNKDNVHAGRCIRYFKIYSILQPAIQRFHTSNSSNHHTLLPLYLSHARI
jgi:hypothetical protein